MARNVDFPYQWILIASLTKGLDRRVRIKIARDNAVTAGGIVASIDFNQLAQLLGVIYFLVHLIYHLFLLLQAINMIMNIFYVFRN